MRKQEPGESAAQQGPRRSKLLLLIVALAVIVGLAIYLATTSRDRVRSQVEPAAASRVVTNADQTVPVDPLQPAETPATSVPSAAIVRFRDELGAAVPYVKVELLDRSWTTKSSPPITLVRIPAEEVGDDRIYGVRAAGYESRRFQLAPEALLEGGQTVVLKGTAAVTVRVLAPDGSGIAGATVTCDSFDTDRSKYLRVATKPTRGRGEAAFDGLPGQSSRLKFSVECAGYVSTSSSLRFRRAGLGTQSIDVQLTREGQSVIHGVVRQSGKPVSGAIVELITGRIPDETRTNASGQFAFNDGPNGKIKLRVRPDTAASEPADWFVARMTVVSLPRVEPLRIEVAAGRVVRVVVTDEAGRPKAKVGVCHWEIRGWMRNPVRTNDQGVAVLGGVAFGKAAIGVVHNSSLRETAVPAGANEVKVVIGNKRVLRGQVVDSKGKPVPGALVRSPGFNRRLKTDTEGRFVCDNADPGGGIVLVELGDRAVTLEYSAQDTELRIVLP